MIVVVVCVFVVVVVIVVVIVDVVAGVVDLFVVAQDILVFSSKPLIQCYIHTVLHSLAVSLAVTWLGIHILSFVSFSTVVRTITSVIM